MIKSNLYEERITIWRAKSFEEAIEKAEMEAKEYADPDAEYTGLAQAFNLFDEDLQEGAEVFSLMHESNYTPKKYLDIYFDNGAERQGHIEEQALLTRPRIVTAPTACRQVKAGTVSLGNDETTSDNYYFTTIDELRPHGVWHME